MSGHFRRTLAASLLLLALLGGAQAEGPELYRATTIVTGQEAGNRERGIIQAFEQVLAKVSGDPRLVGDPSAATLAAQAAGAVEALSYRDRMAGIPVHDEQGTRDRPYDLTVRFRPEAVDDALRALGREPWIGPRPRLVALVVVDSGTQTYLLAADGAPGRDQREALAAAGTRFGMPVIVPRAALLEKAGVTVETLARAAPDLIRTAAAHAGGDMALVGRIAWNTTAFGWAAEWRLTAGTLQPSWSIRDVSFDAAFRSGVGGAMQVLSGHGKPE